MDPDSHMNYYPPNIYKPLWKDWLHENIRLILAPTTKPAAMEHANGPLSVN